jgi:hypothetical protein
MKGSTNQFSWPDSNSTKKFWEELIVYFLFTVILVSDMTFRKTILVCISNEINNTINIVWEASVLVLLMGVMNEVHR